MIKTNKQEILKAVKRLELAKKRNEKIALWGDYDADGIAGTLIVHEALKNLGFNNFLISLSGRRGIYEQGEEEIERFAKEGVSLIVSVDFGITGSKQINLARRKKIGFIVVDHHTPPKVLPRGIIVNYPGGRLAAAVAALELVRAVYRHFRKPEKEIKNFFDLAAIATVADKIILTPANKKIISAGVKRINAGGRPCLKALLAKTRIGKLDSANFERFVDRINFPEGVNEENNLFKLMTLDIKKEEIAKVVAGVEKHYREAQKIISRVFEENAREARAARPAPKVIFAENKIKWPQPGINGIVADEFSHKFKRPVFVYSHSGGKMKASGRAPEGFNLVKALRTCPATLFHNFGGHPRAAGFKADITNLEEIKKCLEKYYHEKI